MTNKEKTISKVEEIARKIKSKGGRAFYVGGLVRDQFTGADNKDIDIEVYGISVDELKDILSTYGKVDEVGVSFGVLMVNNLPVDWTFPRTEVSTGEGHRGFDVVVNPYCSFEEACRRRDFTINSILKDVLTSEIIDPFNGVKDIENRVIKAVDPVTFVEDPLRVFRAAQFSARFGFNIEDKTMDLLYTIDTSSLPKERIYEEYRKMLLKSDKPSIGFEILRKLDLLPVQVKNLINCKQKEQFHPEGDVWTHTMMVLDEAAKLRDSIEESEILMWSALLHDIGKPEVITEDGSSKLHDVIGADIVIEVLKGFTTEKKLLNEIPQYVERHMNLVQLWGQNSSSYALMKLVTKVPDFKLLVCLSKADYLGRGGNHDFTPIEDYIAYKTKKTGIKKPDTLVKGRDLISMGYRPGPVFTQIIDWAYDLQLQGESKDIILTKVKQEFII